MGAKSAILATMIPFQELQKQISVVTAPVRQMEAWLKELGRQWEAVMVPLRAQEWREQTEAISAPARAALEWAKATTAPLRQIEALVARPSITLTSIWQEQIKALTVLGASFAQVDGLREGVKVLLEDIKIEETTRKGYVIYAYRRSKRGMRLTLHPGSPEKGWSPHAHIKDNRGKVYWEQYLPPNTNVHELTLRIGILLALFKRFEGQACN